MTALIHILVKVLFEACYRIFEDIGIERWWFILYGAQR
jgi:hypothetical protein